MRAGASTVPGRLVIATTNAGKVREIRAVLGDLGLVITDQSAYGVLPPVEEDGATYAANALKKAMALASRVKVTVLADDSGLEVDALGGAPGLLSARFAGPHATDVENRQLLLDRLRGVPRERRVARFRCAIALVEVSGVHHIVEGTVEGVIREQEAGCGGFGYDPVFELPDRGLTFAELTEGEKNRISHRGRALAQVRDIFMGKCDP